MKKFLIIIFIFFLISGCTVVSTTDVNNEVDCPFEEIDDPSPGQCGRYIDIDDNNICDLSESLT